MCKRRPASTPRLATTLPGNPASTDVDGIAFGDHDIPSNSVLWGGTAKRGLQICLWTNANWEFANGHPNANGHPKMCRPHRRSNGLPESDPITTKISSSDSNLVSVSATDCCENTLPRSLAGRSRSPGNQGSARARHLDIATATGCRGALLRCHQSVAARIHQQHQCFSAPIPPKGTDLFRHSRIDLAQVEVELNHRRRAVRDDRTQPTPSLGCKPPERSNVAIPPAEMREAGLVTTLGQALVL
jgi:hypothetical protein